MHASGVRASIRSISVALGKSIAESEMMTSDLDAPPRASGPYDWLWTAVFLSKIVAASAKMTPARINPCPPEPENRISYRPLIPLRPPLFLLLQPRDHPVVGLAVFGEPLLLVENAHGEPPGGLLRRQLVERDGRYEGVLHPEEHVRRALELVPPPVRCGTGVHDLDHGEPLVLHRLDDQPVQPGRVVGGSAGDEARPRPLREVGDVERRVDVAVRHGGGQVAGWSGRGVLASRHPVDVVVEYEQRDVDIAPAGVDEVVPADCGGVDVAADHDDALVRLRR